MDKEKQVLEMTETPAQFIKYFGKILPDEIQKKLKELLDQETSSMTKLAYDTMLENQRLARELDRPSCQDSGVIQFFAKVGTRFPLIDEYNTGDNVGFRTPTIDFDIAPNSNELEREINAIGLGPQGFSGVNSVMGVHIENAARHPSTIGVAVNRGCWSH